MRRPFVPLIALALASLGLATPVHAATVSASAWSYETSDGHAGATFATAAISRQAPNAPGDSHAAATAACGALSSSSFIRGCGSDYNSFQQVCNDAGGHGRVDDTLFVTSDYPYSWGIQARATLRIFGEVNGHGGYSYSAMGWIEGQTVIASGTTSGTVQVFDHQPIADTRVWDITLYSGYHEQIAHTLDTDAFQRYCAGGSADCYDSANNWAINVGASSTLQIEILTQGIHAQITSASGHDYTHASAGVGPERASGTSLSPAYPNPARGQVRLALTLAEQRNVDAGVYDVAGRRIATLAHGTLSAGTHALSWNGLAADGRSRSGLFLVRARGEGFDVARRVIVTR